MVKHLVAAALSWICVGASPAWAAPAWCKGAEGGERLSGSASDALKDDVVWAVYGIVSVQCAGADSDKAAEVEAARAAWSKKLELTDDEWQDAAAWAAADQSSRYPGTRLNPKDAKQALSAMDALDQHITLQNDGVRDYDGNYLADAFGPKLSQAGRLAYLTKICLSSNAREVQWAICQPDVDAFDFKQLVEELRADKKHSGYERFLVRLTGHLFPERLKERAAEIAAARAKDPAIEKMFQLSAEARKQWGGLWKNEAPTLDLALSLDDARISNSRRAYQGCEDKTWPAFRDAMAGVPAKKFGAVLRDEYMIHYADDLFGVIASDPKAYLAGMAFYTCGANAERPDAAVRKLGNAFLKWPGHRGPRTSAHSAILSAGLELDDRDARIDYPDTSRGWCSQSGSSSGGGEGTIKALKPQGDKVRIEFASKLEKQEQCLQTQQTNRITQIRSDGSLVYQVNCLKWGVKTYDRRSSPQLVKARYAQGLKPGMAAYTIEEAVIAAWSKPGAKEPAVVAGAPVK